MKRSPKTQLSENADQSGHFWKRRFHVSLWTVKIRVFRDRWRLSIWSSLPSQKIMAEYDDFTFLLCIKQLRNILGSKNTCTESCCTNPFFWKWVLRHKQIQNDRVLCLTGLPINNFRRLYDFVLKGDSKKELNFVVRPSKQTSQSYPFSTRFLTVTYSNSARK